MLTDSFHVVQRPQETRTQPRDQQLVMFVMVRRFVVGYFVCDDVVPAREGGRISTYLSWPVKIHVDIPFDICHTIWASIYA